jgi:hypothetical protein
MRPKRKETVDLDKVVATPAQLTSITDLTDRRLEQLAAEGHFPKKIKAGWKVADVFRGLLKYYRELLEDSKSGLRTEQEELTRARKEIAREELKVRLGKSIAREEVGAALENASASMAAALRMIFEQEIAPKLPLLKPDEQLNLIQDGVDRVCEVFNENMKPWMLGLSAEARRVRP